jgi:hypothetical protein
LFHPSLHFARELAQTAPAGGDDDFVKGLPEHGWQWVGLLD